MGDWVVIAALSFAFFLSPPVLIPPPPPATKPCPVHHRDPSSRLKQFAKEVRLIFPGASRINRGGYKMDALVAAARKSDFTDIVIVHEHRGEPDAMTISHLPYGPTAFFQLASVVMRHDIEGVEPVSEVRALGRDEELF